MKTCFYLCALLLAANTVIAQDIEKKLNHFNRVVVSPKINLVLIPGNEESVRISYTDVDRHRIKIEQSGRKLHIYLEDAKIYDIGEKRENMFERRERYKYTQVTAYVTFKNLTVIESRGEGEVTCDGAINSGKLKIRLYGEVTADFAHIEAGKIRARLYGENRMRIHEGEAGHLSYKIYGENKIDSRGLTSVTSATTIYGEGQIRLRAEEELRVNSFGEPQLFLSGNAVVSKGIILGNARIRRN